MWWNKREIVTFSDQLSTLTQEQLALTLIHERGHCDYNFGHSKLKELDDGCPAEVMYWEIPSPSCATAHLADYVAAFDVKAAATLIADPSTARSLDYESVDPSHWSIEKF